MSTAYKTVHDIAGPLLMVKDVEGVAYDELCEIELTDGSKRLGKVLESREGLAIVQLFESAQGATTEGTKVRFLGRSFELGVSEDMLGRIFNGSGKPMDGGPELVPEKKLDIKTGESTKDKKFFLKREEECLAACCGGPMMMIDHIYYENLTTDKVDEILDSLD